MSFRGMSWRRPRACPDWSRPRKPRSPTSSSPCSRGRAMSGRSSRSATTPHRPAGSHPLSGSRSSNGWSASGSMRARMSRSARDPRGRPGCRVRGLRRAPAESPCPRVGHPRGSWLAAPFLRGDGGLDRGPDLSTPRPGDIRESLARPSGERSGVVPNDRSSLRAAQPLLHGTPSPSAFIDFRHHPTEQQGADRSSLTTLPAIHDRADESQPKQAQDQ